MSLPELQRGLGALVALQAADPEAAERTTAVLDSLDLSPDERAWLTRLRGTPGFKVTCDIQRWWRETRLGWTARLTLSALPQAERAALLQRYLSRVRCRSLFFAPEAIAFLGFAARALADRPHLAALARFERAVVRAREADPEPARALLRRAEKQIRRQIRSQPALARLLGVSAGA
jgi:hypothetical protein